MDDLSRPPEAILGHVIDLCLKAGGSAADARLSVSESISVEVRGGALEAIERAEDRALSLRCFFGQRQAHVSGADLSEDGLQTMASRCAAMARVAPEDPYCGLPDPADLASDGLDRDLDLAGEPEPSPDMLEADAMAAEAAAMAVDGVTTISSCGAGWSSGETWMAASNGFAGRDAGGHVGLGLAAVAERDGKMERDYESRTVRYLEDRPTAEEIGTIAGERTVARLGARKIPTQTAPVIYDRRVAPSLLSALIGAISGPSVARGISFLKDRLGEMVFAPGVDIIDDPFRRRGLGSRLFDGEGYLVAETKLIEDGRLTCWLLNGPAGRQLGLEPNGFSSPGFGDPPGVAPSNLYLAAGTPSPEDLMRSAGKGLLVTDMFGPSINPNTGDYSVGVAGFWFEEGAVAHPVSEVTIAGDLPAMFARLVPASDLEFRGTNDAPSLLIEDMSIAGQ